MGLDNKQSSVSISRFRSSVGKEIMYGVARVVVPRLAAALE